jgi:hypothetical protein
MSWLQNSLNNIDVMSNTVDRLKTLILSIVNSQKPTGNPITEHQYHLLFNAYGKISACFSTQERENVRLWAISIADAQIKSYNEGFRIINNFQSHRLNIIANIGKRFNIRSYIDWAYARWLEQIDNNLNADGSSLDFLERDSLTYHVFNLQALVFASLYLQSFYPRFNFYTYVSPKCCSLKKSVQFLIPYIEGKKTNIMFVNTKFASDRQTQPALVGQPWDKMNARNLILQCRPFDPSLKIIIDKHYTPPKPTR